MSEPPSPTLAPMVSKLQLWRPLDEQDREAILALPHRVRRIEANHYIVRNGDKPQQTCLLLSGFAFRYKMAGNGGRQIFSIHMKGDVVDLENSLLHAADHDVQALTSVEAAFIPLESIQEIAFSRPAVGKAMWYETLVNGSMFREWTLNVGRRDARTRTAHMLCEFLVRLRLVGLAEDGEYELPMTQERLADALGLTPVHVNRTLQSLAADGLITRRQRNVRIADLRTLAKVGDFDPGYLHLPGNRAQAILL